MAATFLAGPRRHPDHDHPAEEDHGCLKSASVVPWSKRHRGGRPAPPLWSTAMTGADLLEQAAVVVSRRRREYGEPVDLSDQIAQRWSCTIGVSVSPAQVALCLIDLKLARLAHDPKHLDSLVDVAGYAAVLREVTR